MSAKIVLGLLVALAAPPVCLAGGEIHGELRTTDDRVLTGPIRWDRNENFWDDRLDVIKPAAPPEGDEPEREGFKLSLFGWNVAEIRADSRTVVRRSLSVPFGHLQSIERVDHRRARLTLKGGETFLVEGSTTDLGTGMRGLEIEDAEAGRVQVHWAEFQSVEFKAHRGPSRDGRRLHARVETAAGSHEGFVVWGRDESMSEDVLDGTDAEGVEHRIPFGEIREIARLERGGRSRVKLDDGRVLVLGGTSDVDHGHGGLEVFIAGRGTVSIEWRDVRRVVFGDPPPSRGYDRFDGGSPLRGVLTTTDGRRLRGRIVWDLDESRDWETLDGKAGSEDWSIPFVEIRAVTRLGHHASRVELRDGFTIELEGTNDVDSDNAGLVLTGDDGSVVRLDWGAFEKVEFD